MKLQTNRKKLGQALVVLLASGSFLGLSALPATAEDSTTYTVDVYVTDTTYVCEDPTSDPYWIPDGSVTYYDTEVNLEFSNTLDFGVNLGFYAGYDPCDNVEIDPTGDIDATFVDLPTPLSMNFLNCFENTCRAESLYANTSSMIDGSLLVDSATVELDTTYYADLKVTWTLDQGIE
jgi:hypothetical protein